MCNTEHFSFVAQVGLFRKSGVKSRIQALRQMNENAIGKVNYEGQSAYDVADMLKQYFRNLSEPLMTNKLSETFLQIYQCKSPMFITRLPLKGPDRIKSSQNLPCSDSDSLDHRINVQFNFPSFCRTQNISACLPPLYQILCSKSRQSVA